MRILLIILSAIIIFLGSCYWQKVTFTDDQESFEHSALKDEGNIFPLDKNRRVESKINPEGDNSINREQSSEKSNDYNDPENQSGKIKRTDDDFLNTETRKNRAIINEKVGENYIDSILLNGKLMRWNPSTFPIRVYIENNPNLPPYYYQQIRKAFERWQSVSGNYITFRFTDIKDKADIRCTFPAQFERKCGVSNIAAWHNYKLQNNIIKYSEIQFAKVSCQRKLYPAEIIYSTALHEIGHSLGLNGHSPNSDDLMYASTSTKKDITGNDIRTLKLVYSIIPDISNAPFTENDKKGLITPDDVWGNSDNRIEMELREIKDKIKNADSTAYSEYVKMGNLYFQKEDFPNAIKNYKKSLEIATEESNIAAINSRLATSYSKLRDFSSALTYAQAALDKEPTDYRITTVAGIYYEMGDYDKAKSMTRNLLNRNSKVYNAYIILGNIYMKEKDYKSLMSLYERGKRNFPDNPPINVIQKKNN